MKEGRQPVMIMTGAIFEEIAATYPNKIGAMNASLGEDDPCRVHELYGSMRTSRFVLPTARPDFRIPDVELWYLTDYVKACHDNGLKFNYTMNGNFAGDLEKLSHDHDDIVNNLKTLESIGVDRITVSHPILLDLVCKHTKLPIECSTIMNINSLQAPREIKSRYPNVNKICLGIDKVRNVNFVKKMRKVCSEVGIDLEIMVSEFCAIGMMSCTNLHRNTCYNMHSMNMTEDVARKGINSDGTRQQPGIKGYPWSSGKTGCIFGRSVEPAAWLASRTIWPNEIGRYCDTTGVNMIKVTNRTAPPDFAMAMTMFYCRGRYDDLLAGLWLALPASTLSARERFEELQKTSSEAIPYACSDLSTPMPLVDVALPGCKRYNGRAKFMDVFFDNPDVDWNDILWVDKPSSECASHESNWIHKWMKLLEERAEQN